MIANISVSTWNDKKCPILRCAEVSTPWGKALVVMHEEAIVEYLFGKKAVLPYMIIAIIFMFLGSLLSNNLVWELADMFNQLMVVPNVLALLALSGMIINELKDATKK